MRLFCVAAIFLALPTVVQAADIQGKITNVVGGEPLGRISVSILELKLETSSGPDGSFQIRNVPAGNYTLRVSAVGFRLLTEAFSINTPADTREFAIVMVPDNFRRTDVVAVTGDVFHAGNSPAVVEQNLSSSEIREASTVLADDPFRAIQTLPGVSASGNNELLADFTVMGAPFDQVGIYLDDVLIPPPFHNGANITNGASLSLLTSEIIDDLRLLPAAYPERYGDQIGAALDIHTRDGSMSKPLFRAAVGLGDTDITAEGRLGGEKRGSWLGAFRRSYLGYLTRNLIRSDFADISFYDGSLKLSYDLTPHHTIALFGIGGDTLVDDPTATSSGDVRRATSDFIFLRTGWRWSITPHLLLDSRAAYIRQPASESNPSGLILGQSSYGEWVGGSNVAWAWSTKSTLQGGWTLRRLSDHVSDFAAGQSQAVSVTNQVALRANGFLEQSSSLFGDRVHLLGSVRIDGRQDLGVTPFSAQGSIAWRFARATEVQGSVGRYAQLEFPDFQFGQGTPCSFVERLYDRSNHFSLGLGQRVGENTQVRVQFFDRQNSFLVSTTGGTQCQIPVQQGTSEFARSYSRGVQFVLQRRSANRLSGWIGYTFVRARQSSLFSTPPQPPFYSPYFDSSTDQPASVNALASYRWRPSVNLGAKLIYGSGFPTVSGLERTASGGIQPLPDLRLPDYFRADFRIDKSWALRLWKMTLYGEVLNLTDHDNRILSFIELSPTGRQVAHTQRALPLTPTAGLVFEF